MSIIIHKPLPRTMQGLLKRLGGIAPSRVRLRPLPGFATEADLVRTYESEKVLCELIDGILVEKTAGAEESFLTMHLVILLGNFMELHDLGALMGPDGAIRLMPGLIRIPHISFVTWEKRPQRVYPRDPIANLIPDLAIEVLSKGNTRREMALKLRDYIRCRYQARPVREPQDANGQCLHSPRQIDQTDGRSNPRRGRCPAWFYPASPKVIRTVGRVRVYPSRKPAS